jgi:hypothetical protein
MKRLILGCFVIFSPLLASAAPRAPIAIPEVQISGTRIHLSDVVPTAPAEMANLDLGAAPAGGGSRIFAQGDLALALGDKMNDSKNKIVLPTTIRVVRKMHKLDIAELEQTTKASIATMHLWRGASLFQARPTHAAEVPAGWTKIDIDVPRPPHRSGMLATNATLSFQADGETLAKVIVPIDLMLSDEAARPDITHGSEIQLVVKRGLVEVATPATAGADGDEGDVISVTVKASNRVLRARVQDATHAVALEGA